MSALTSQYRGAFYPLVLALLITFSRLYLSAHYRADVLAGAVLGAAIGLGMSYLLSYLLRKSS